MKNKVCESDWLEIGTEEADQTYGGVPFLPFFVSWLVYDIAANPRKSYDAFMAGWNSF